MSGLTIEDFERHLLDCLAAGTPLQKPLEGLLRLLLRDCVDGYDPDAPDGVGSTHLANEEQRTHVTGTVWMVGSQRVEPFQLTLEGGTFDEARLTWGDIGGPYPLSELGTHVAAWPLDTFEWKLRFERKPSGWQLCPQVPTLRLKTFPEQCGPIIIGTVSLIKALHETLELELSEAQALVEQSIFDEHGVELHPPTQVAALRLMEAARKATADVELAFLSASEP